jgi:hypothetical protein
MQPFQQQQRDQGCPNLDAKRILAGANETLHGPLLSKTGFDGARI